jgi:hypothetical protein
MVTTGTPIPEIGGSCDLLKMEAKKPTMAAIAEATMVETTILRGFGVMRL